MQRLTIWQHEATVTLCHGGSEFLYGFEGSLSMEASFFSPTKKESMDVDSEVDCFAEVCMRLWTTRKLVLNLNGWMSDWCGKKDFRRQTVYAYLFLP